MGELWLWIVWAAALVYANVFDPVAWVVFLAAALWASTRTRTLGLACAATLFVGAGFYVTLLDLIAVRGEAPVLMLTIYHASKALWFALGVAFNRLILQRATRAARVLEKAGT